MTSRMHESACTDLWEPWGSNPLGRPGHFLCLADFPPSPFQVPMSVPCDGEPVTPCRGTYGLAAQGRPRMSHI
jgi:hypothetical protein